jgi:hypothetical protein
MMGTLFALSHTSNGLGPCWQRCSIIPRVADYTGSLRRGAKQAEKA